MHLFIASAYGHFDIVKYLIEKGFDGNIKNETGETALHYGKITHFDHSYPLFLFFIAAQNGHFDIVKYL